MRIFRLFIILLAVLAFSASGYAQTNIAGQFGNATVASNPTISCTPPTLAFGPQVINTTGPALAITCSNPGNALVTLTNIAESGANFALTTGQNSCVVGSNISPGTNCLVFVNFSPTAVTGYTGTVTVTATGASGSPQTINLTGNGVNSGGGGPGSFTMPTNLVDSSCGTPPCTYTFGANYPSSFTENTVVTDNAVVHTSAGGISGSNKTAFFLCAGQNAANAANANNSSVPTNISWHTHSGASANEWSPDKSQIMLGASIGQYAAVFSVNLAPGVGFGCTWQQPLPAGYTGGSDPPTASHTVNKQWYGYCSNGPNLCLFDSSTNPGTVTQVYTFSGTPPMGSAGPCPGLPTSGLMSGTGFDSSQDVTASGYDTRIAGGIEVTGEAQNTESYAVVLDHRASTGFTCRWYNVKTDSIGGDTNFAGGSPGSCTGCLGQSASGGSGIHNMEISKDGNYLAIAEQNTIGVVIWNIASTTITQAPAALTSGGHRTWGLNILTWFTSGSNAAINYVTGAAPTTIVRLSNRFPQGQIPQHISWEGPNANQNNGVYQSTYVNVTTPCIDNTQPGVGEMLISLMDGTTKTYRALRTRSNSCSGIDNAFFYATPRGNITGDQSFATFSSNQNGLFGLDNGGTQAHSRVYVFIAELR